MNNKKISASGVNKFLYCNYQWYYEQKYGRKRLMELYKERNKAYNYNNLCESNFIKGIKFHNNYIKENKKKKIYTLIIIFIILTVLIYFLFAIYSYYI